MRRLSRLLRANCLSASRRTCRPVFSTPPSLVHPTKAFATTPAHQRFQVASRKEQPAYVNMAGGDMTTYTGKPFDRPSLESLMRVRAQHVSWRC
jgi:glycyl-tRNA synthetase